MKTARFNYSACVGVAVQTLLNPFCDKKTTTKYIYYIYSLYIVPPLSKNRQICSSVSIFICILSREEIDHKWPLKSGRYAGTTVNARCDLIDSALSSCEWIIQDMLMPNVNRLTGGGCSPLHSLFETGLLLLHYASPSE